MLIGISGNTCSGKSEVANYLMLNEFVLLECQPSVPVLRAPSIPGIVPGYNYSDREPLDFEDSYISTNSQPLIPVAGTIDLPSPIFPPSQESVNTNSINSKFDPPNPSAQTLYPPNNVSSSQSSRQHFLLPSNTSSENRSEFKKDENYVKTGEGDFKNSNLTQKEEKELKISTSDSEDPKPRPKCDCSHDEPNNEHSNNDISKNLQISSTSSNRSNSQRKTINQLMNEFSEEEYGYLSSNPSSVNSFNSAIPNIPNIPALSSTPPVSALPSIATMPELPNIVPRTAPSPAPPTPALASSSIIDTDTPATTTTTLDTDTTTATVTAADIDTTSSASASNSTSSDKNNNNNNKVPENDTNSLANKSGDASSGPNDRVDPATQNVKSSTSSNSNPIHGPSVTDLIYEMRNNLAMSSSSPPQRGPTTPIPNIPVSPQHQPYSQVSLQNQFTSQIEGSSIYSRPQAHSTSIPLVNATPLSSSQQHRSIRSIVPLPQPPNEITMITSPQSISAPQSNRQASRALPPPSRHRVYEASNGTVQIVFDHISTLMEYVVANWRSDFVIVVKDTDMLQRLEKLPFFLHITVDAPVIQRWKRFLKKVHDYDYDTVHKLDIDKLISILHKRKQAIQAAKSAAAAAALASKSSAGTLNTSDSSSKSPVSSIAKSHKKKSHQNDVHFQLDEDEVLNQQIVNETLQPPVSLESFIQESDACMYGPKDELISVTSQARIKIINHHEGINNLYVKLGKLRLKDSERLRPSWDLYFMRLADLAALRSNCMKRRVGCVVVRENRVIATGYNGTPRGMTNCNAGGCKRCNGAGNQNNLNQGTNFPIQTQISGANLDSCLCLHAEENALLEAGRDRVGSNSVIYCNTAPCLTCSIKIVQAGIKEVVFAQPYSTGAQNSENIFREAKINFRQFIPPNEGVVM